MEAIKWKSYTGEMILNKVISIDGKVLSESIFEDAIKLGVKESSNGQLELLKLYWTDGFGWYFNNNKITFVLHESKANLEAKTLKGYTTCLKKALLQDIGYYFKLIHGEYKILPKELIDLSEQLGYNTPQECIKNNFGLFLLTNEIFISNIFIDDNMKTLLDKLEPLIKTSDKSPSKYWEDKNLRKIMQDFDVSNYGFQFMAKDADLANTGDILNKIIN